MARRGRDGEGLKARDRFWLRHLERQAAGSETSKAYAAREGLPVYALYRPLSSRRGTSAPHEGA